MKGELCRALFHILRTRKIILILPLIWLKMSQEFYICMILRQREAPGSSKDVAVYSMGQLFLAVLVAGLAGPTVDRSPDAKVNSSMEEPEKEKEIPICSYIDRIMSAGWGISTWAAARVA